MRWCEAVRGRRTDEVALDDREGEEEEEVVRHLRAALRAADEAAHEADLEEDGEVEHAGVGLHEELHRVVEAEDRHHAERDHQLHRQDA